jgi:hypothetical protein
VRIIALLAWYDEPLCDLRRAVESCAGLVDHIVAIDGRYRHFNPDGLTASGHVPREVIGVAADRLRIAHTIVTPSEPWESEGAKRTALFRVAEAVGEVGTDWVIPLDADEEFVCPDPAAVRTALALSTHPVHGLHYETPVPERTPLLEAGTDLRTLTLPRVLRLHHGMYVVPPTHYQFRTVDGIDLTRHADPIPGLHMLHHTASRSIHRQQTKAEYIQKRTEIGEC